MSLQCSPARLLTIFSQPNADRSLQNKRGIAAQHKRGIAAASILSLIWVPVLVGTASMPSTAQIGIITTVAGGGPNHVKATKVPLCGPSTVVTDSQQNLYFTLQCQSLVVRVDHVTNVLTIVAGDGAAILGGPIGDGGLAPHAILNQPIGLAIDGAGNLFIADTDNNRIRRVDAVTHIITTIAGEGSGCVGQTDSLGDGCPAADALMNQPYAVLVDGGGNLLIADEDRIRRIDVTTGIITSIVGGGNGCAAQSDSFGDGCPATTSILQGPTGMALDARGDLFIAQINENRIRRVDVSTHIITTVAGGGSGCTGEMDNIGDGCPATSAVLTYPIGIALDGAQNLIIADNGSQFIRKVDSATGIITVLAGVGNGGNSCPGQTDKVGDGCPATSAQFSPYGVTLDASGNLLIADWGNGRIRRIDAGTDVVTTVAGGGTGSDIPATSTQLLGGSLVAVDNAGNLFITEFNRVRRVDALSHLITAFAGGGNGCAEQTDSLGDGCLATSARVQPYGLATDALGNVFIADVGNSRIRRVDHITHIITTVAGNGHRGYSGDNGPAITAELLYAGSVAVDSAGNLYIGDYGNNRVRRVDAGSGVITTVAGSGAEGYSGDGGPATAAALDLPDGVAVDGNGNLFISDGVASANGRIRRVDATTGVITTIVSGLPSPSAVAADAIGNVLISANARVFRFDSVTGNLITVAGNGINAFSGDGGPAINAELSLLFGVAVDNSENLFIAGDGRIRKVPLGLPAVSLSAASLNFGTVQTNSQNATKIVSLRNTGTALLEFFDIGISGGFVESDSCRSGVEPGATCQITVTLSEVGPQSGTLAIKPNIAGSPRVVSLSGTGTGTVTNISLTRSPLRSVFGQVVRFMASVSSGTAIPTGSVTLLDGMFPLVSAPLISGKASLSTSALTAGTHSITAVYQGTPGFGNTTSALVPQMVSRAITATALVASPSRAVVLQLVTFTATVGSQFTSPKTGSVMFSANGSVIATAPLSGNVATLRFRFPSAGIRSITARYAGDSNNIGSTSASLELPILTATKTIVTASANPAFVGQMVTFKANVSSVAGLPPDGETIIFTKNTTLLGTAALIGGAASFSTTALGATTWAVRARYAGDDTFGASVGLAQEVFQKYSTSTAISSNFNPSNHGQSVTFTATVTSSPPNKPSGNITFREGTKLLGIVTLNSGVGTLTTSTLAIGTHAITAIYGGNAASLQSISAPLNQVVK
jgi:sugar lactone lactonase YvrE